MKSKIFFLIIGLALILSVSARAQEQPANPELMARLERMTDETDWKLKTSSGAYKGKWLLHQFKLRRIVEEIKAGKPADARTIEALQKEHRDLLP